MLGSASLLIASRDNTRIKSVSTLFIELGLGLGKSMPLRIKALRDWISANVEVIINR